MKKTSVKQLHAEWSAKTQPRGASQTQLQETERAFYAGAFSVFSLILGEVTPLPEDEAQKRLEEIQDEMRDYFKLLGKIPGTHGTSRQ